MKKTILYSLLILLTYSCGPSAKEKEARRIFVADSIIAAKTTQTEIVPVETPVVKYFSASEFNLIPGKISGWAPTDEAVGEMKCAGGDKIDRQIYVQIQDESGRVTVIPCDYKAWVNLHTGDVLK